MSSTNKIISIYKSRKTIIELLEKQEYDTTEYNNFNVNEIDAMISTNQLDMLLSKTDKKTNKSSKIYIKYYLESKQLRSAILDDIIEDLFTLEATLNKDDTLVVIIDNEPNESIISKIEYLYDHDGIFVVIFNIQRLQFNVLNHKLVPPIKILDDNEREEFLKKYNINSMAKIPEIGRFDPQAQAVFLRPGDICKFERESFTALKYDYYRICI